MKITGVSNVSCEIGEPIDNPSKESKTKDLTYLFLTSPLILTCIATIASFFLLPAYLSIGIIAAVMVGITFFPSYLPQKFLYEIALIDSLVRDRLTKNSLINQPYYNEIFPGMYLGALPLKSHGHHHLLIRRLEIKAILSIVEDFELKTETFFSLPVEHELWRELGIITLQIITGDMTSVTLEELHQAADFIKEHESSLYIHCKAGRGRSIMSLIAYLMKYKKMAYLIAHAFSKERRPVLTLTRDQEATLREFEEDLYKRGQ